MTSEDLTIPVGKYDFIWATHDRHIPKPDDDAPLAIMIHGFPGDSKSYGNVFEELSQRFVKGGCHTLRFDIRGCGQSNKAARFFTLKSAHEDCLAVFRWAEKLGYKKFYIIAEGLGASIAVTALTDTVRPLVRGLVLLWPILDQKRCWLADLLPAAAEIEREGQDHMTVENTQLGLAFLREIATYNLIPLLSRITMPVMIHHGLNDRKAPPAQMDVLIQGAGTDRLEFVTYDGGEHGLKDPLQRQRLLQETRNFLKKIR